MSADTSLVNDVLELVVALRKQKQQVSEMRDTHVPKEKVLEMLEDLVCQCAGLMSSMLAAPLTGRMFVDQDIGISAPVCQQHLTDTLIHGI